MTSPDPSYRDLTSAGLALGQVMAGVTRDLLFFINGLYSVHFMTIFVQYLSPLGLFSSFIPSNTIIFTTTIMSLRTHHYLPLASSLLPIFRPFSSPLSLFHLNTTTTTAINTTTTINTTHSPLYRPSVTINIFFTHYSPLLAFSSPFSSPLAPFTCSLTPISPLL